jgi:hypothetical protein
VSGSPEDAGVSLQGSGLRAARDVAVRWVLAPAAEAMGGADWPLPLDGPPAPDPRVPAALRAWAARAEPLSAVGRVRVAVGLLERLGWPGDPLAPVALAADDAGSLRLGAYRQLAEAGGTVDEVATLVFAHGRAWDAAPALNDLDEARALLDRLGWYATSVG